MMKRINNWIVSSSEESINSIGGLNGESFSGNDSDQEFSSWKTKMGKKIISEGEPASSFDSKRQRLSKGQ